MADANSKMVLRTVYLPPELDEQLRVRAFREKTTKGDLIREGLTLLFRDRAGDEPSAKPAVDTGSKIKRLGPGIAKKLVIDRPRLTRSKKDTPVPKRAGDHSA